MVLTWYANCGLILIKLKNSRGRNSIRTRPQRIEQVPSDCNELVHAFHRLKMVNTTACHKLRFRGCSLKVGFRVRTRTAFQVTGRTKRQNMRRLEAKAKTRV